MPTRMSYTLEDEDTHTLEPHSQWDHRDERQKIHQRYTRYHKYMRKRVKYHQMQGNWVIQFSVYEFISWTALFSSPLPCI